MQRVMLWAVAVGSVLCSIVGKPPLTNYSRTLELNSLLKGIRMPRDEIQLYFVGIPEYSLASTFIYESIFMQLD